MIIITSSSSPSSYWYIIIFIMYNPEFVSQETALSPAFLGGQQLFNNFALAYMCCLDWHLIRYTYLVIYSAEVLVARPYETFWQRTSYSINYCLTCLLTSIIVFYVYLLVWCNTINTRYVICVVFFTFFSSPLYSRSPSKSRYTHDHDNNTTSFCAALRRVTCPWHVLVCPCLSL